MKRYLIGIVVLVLIVGGVYYLGLSRDIEKKQDQVTTIPVSETVISATPKDVAVSSNLNWKTYRNENYGFEFKYPNDFKMEEKSGRISVSDGLDPKTSFSVFINPQVGFEGYDPYKSPKVLMVGNEKFKIEYDKSNDGQLFIHTSVSKNGDYLMIYLFSYKDSNSAETIFTNILSTLKLD